MHTEDVWTAVILSFFGFLLAWLTAEDQIFGVDSWYWLKVANAKPIEFNAMSFFFIVSVLIFFNLSGKREWKMAFVWFMLNFFVQRFVAVELDDFLMYYVGFAIITWLYRNGKSKYAVLFGVLFVVFYAVLHNFTPFDYSFHRHLEENPTVGIAYFLPLVYLLTREKKWFELALLLALTIVYPNKKVCGQAMVVLVYALQLEVEPVRSNAKIIFLFTLMAVLMIYSTYFYITNNQKYFSLLCNRKTRVCNNTDVRYWWLGHYFAYRGYKCTDPAEFGVMLCKGVECLNCTLQ